MIKFKHITCLKYIPSSKCWILIFHAGGKSQKSHEEAYGEQAQLTHFKPLTQETDSLQLPLASSNVGHQSVSQGARLSTGSVDSGVGRSSSHNSYTKLFHLNDTGEVASPVTQLLSAYEDDCTRIGSTQLPSTGTDTPFPAMKIGKDDDYLRQIYQLISELREEVKELSGRVGNLERVQTKCHTHSPSESSFAMSESNPKQAPFSSPCHTEVAGSEQFTNMHISINLQARPPTKSPLCRHHSDSQANYQRREEIRNKLKPSKQRPFSEFIDVSTVCMMLLFQIKMCNRI